MSMTFGEFIRNRRINQNLTLRQFCKKTGYDVGYISRLENSLFMPPEEGKKLLKLAQAFDIKQGSLEWETYQDLATVAQKKLPKDIDQDVLNFLPAFFRKASKKHVKREDVEKLIRLIKGHDKR